MSKLNETELKMQVFDLKKAGKIMDTPALVLIFCFKSHNSIDYDEKKCKWRIFNRNRKRR